MAHKQSAKRIPASKKPVSKKLPPPSSPFPSENEEEEKDQQQNLDSPLPLHPHAPSPKQSKSKKNKKNENENENENDDETEEKKEDRGPALRMNWTGEDETAILKGMAAFKASIHHDPYKDAEAFRDFMKESEYSLPEASIVQLKAKIRKMKSKFARGIGGHEFKKLAKKVWEPEKNTECEEQEQEQERERNSKRMSGSGSKRLRFEEPEWEEGQERGDDDDDDSKGIIGNWSELLPGVSEEVLNRAFNSIEASERAEWVARWEKHKIAEFELCVNKTQLIRDLARLMWGAYKSSNN